MSLGTARFVLQDSPVAKHHLASVALVLLDGGVADHPHVLVGVKTKQRARLAPGPRHYEVVERVCLGNNQILLNVHQLVGRHSFQLGELGPNSFQDL